MIRTVLTLAISLSMVTSAMAQVVKTTPGKSGSRLIKDGDVVEVFVDENGKIYKELRYHGIIPNIRDSLKPKQPTDTKKKTKKIKRKKSKTARITWMGFQPKEFYSRVFVQTDKVSRFTLHKPDPLRIVATFVNARIPKRNNRRRIVTQQFKSMVKEITTRRHGKNVQVVISLRKPVGYLYKRDRNYVFIDVER